MKYKTFKIKRLSKTCKNQETALKNLKFQSKSISTLGKMS